VAAKFWVQRLTRTPEARKPPAAPKATKALVVVVFIIVHVFYKIANGKYECAKFRIALNL
jgi:hypothetical protein